MMIVQPEADILHCSPFYCAACISYVLNSEVTRGCKPVRYLRINIRNDAKLIYFHGLGPVSPKLSNVDQRVNWEFTVIKPGV